ncbi:MAG: 1-(5-phosphoribosyl)-5-[(5-phosphoribosylamino)methylideneamino]imidazole-4-carboxamide isomerase [Clostridia bacterium]|nr:1-(5-phosphoribosyl)-5-[(5-phosphoribosylamino)methylideneamino]imidazole-4-carboxamide isomerase [Clostridia bacterium]
MEIYPAIDLLAGEVVRLRQGVYTDVTVYAKDPVEAAKNFAAQGATNLHIVDLDAARGRGQINLKTIEAIASSVKLFIEVGGGARDKASVANYISSGVDRVIIGSMAVENPEMTDELAREYPSAIAVGVDARDGRVAIHGWRVVTELDAFEFIEALPGRGVSTVIYTDISRDGMLEGPNIASYERLASIPGLQVIASGGVTSAGDVRALSKLGIHGAIIGKALYDGRITLAEAIAAGREGI